MILFCTAFSAVVFGVQEHADFGLAVVIFAVSMYMYMGDHNQVLKDAEAARESVAAGGPKE